MRRFAAPAALAFALLQSPSVAGAADAALDPSAAKSDRSYTLPASEIVAFDFLLSNFNRRFSGTSDYDVSLSSIRRNLRGPWVVDDDPFKVNQFAHPYQGALYHGAARSAGLSYWESSALTFAGSAWWEWTGEQTPPARNDQIASGIAGSFLGEPLFRLAHLLLNQPSSVPYAWRQWGAAVISPGAGLNRALFGTRVDAGFDDHDPVYFSRLRLGTNHVTRDEAGASTKFKPNEAEFDFAVDYGLPGKPGYTYRRPFDYFSLQAVASSANGIQTLSSRGLLFGTDYALGDSYRGIWGLYASYDYFSPQIFHVSSTALSLGTTGQWWLPKGFVLQGTGLAGIGYSAASTVHGIADDRDYHYGAAPRVALEMRLSAGERASVNVAAQKYFLGRIANSAAGRDDVTRADASLTWRVSGRHALGVKYIWSHRSANYPVIGDRRQTFATAGVFYTLLGGEGFGVVDWREEPTH
ncbi:MAG: DUF3943 domain-containing protein [Rhizobacter sp.]